MKIASLLYPVKNIEKSIGFFTERLGFPIVDSDELKLSEIEESVVKLQALRIGEEIIGLLEFENSGNVMPSDSRSNDHWFQH